MERRYAYGKYKKVRNAAWQCLIDCQVRSLPVNLKAVAAASGVKLCSYNDNGGMLQQKGYAPLLKSSGFAYVDMKGATLIFFDQWTSHQQIRYTVAHELGHILLGHVGSKGEIVPLGTPLLPSDPKLEREADRFAIRLLAPACALWAMNAYSPGEIATICDIPLERAWDRAKRMRVLQERNRWLTDPQEQALFKQMALSVPGRR